MPALTIRLAALALLACISAPALAGDVSVKLDAGVGFSLKDNTGATELLRVDEATGNMSRNGALFVHTTGTNNTFVGDGAGNPATTALASSAFGSGALAALTTGYANTAGGRSALTNNTSGDQNTAFGGGALYSNTIGTANSAFGSGALYSNTITSGNSAFGNGALLASTDGYSNSAFGASALIRNTTAGRNAAFGASALAFNTTGIWNTALGTGALFGNRTGGHNVAIGGYSGSYQVTGSNNIYLVNYGVNGESGQIKIGTVGTHTGTTVAGIHSATSSGGIAVLVNASGKLGTTTSSARFKQDVRDLDDASDLLMRLRPVTFRYKPEVAPGEDGVQYGLIAEEVAKVAPELVAPDLDGKPYSVRYHELPALLLAQNQAQQRTIEALAARVAELEAERRSPSR